MTSPRTVPELNKVAGCPPPSIPPVEAIGIGLSNVLLATAAL